MLENKLMATALQQEKPWMHQYDVLVSLNSQSFSSEIITKSRKQDNVLHFWRF